VLATFLLFAYLFYFFRVWIRTSYVIVGIVGGAVALHESRRAHPRMLHRYPLSHGRLNRRRSRYFAAVHRREYWFIYRLPGFLPIVWFGSSPTPPQPPYPVNKLDRKYTGRLRKREEGRVWARSKKAWSFINHSILSAPPFVKTLPAIQREEKLRERG